MLYALGLVKVCAGSVALLALPPAYVLSVNSGGIPRWIPHAVALVLATCATVSDLRPGLVRALLAATWALLAAGFSRPALVATGWPSVPIELVAVPLALVAACLAGMPEAGRWRAVTLISPLVSLTIVALALAVPLAASTRLVDAVAYTTVAGLAAYSAAPSRKGETA